MEYFKGMQAQGTWTLRVRDDLTDGATGTVNAWSLEVCEAAPRPACVVPGPAETTILSTDFEANDGGFTHAGTLDEWERGLPTFAPITSAHSGTNAFKTDLDNTYDNSSNSNLVSPSIDLTGVTGRITLNWWQKFQIETASFDNYWVEVRQVGAPPTARRLVRVDGRNDDAVSGQPDGDGPAERGLGPRAGRHQRLRGHDGRGPVPPGNGQLRGQFAGVAIDDVSVTSCTQIVGAAPAGLAVDAAGNSVYEPNETVVVAPRWRNDGTAVIALTGELTNHTGPAGATYTVVDDTGGYGTIAVGATASCTDCYSVSNTLTTRPATHWDSTALETVTPTSNSKNWVLHIGNSFTDVLSASGFYRFVETILHKGVTGGCGATTYCPSASTTREQMAVFVLVSKEPPGYTPPACAPPNLFNDVPETSPFCRWVEELANRGVVTGCGGGNYCPTQPRHPRADGGLRPAHPGSDAQPAGLRTAEPVRGRPGDQPLLQVDRRAGQPRRGHGMRRRELLPDRQRHPRADVRLPRRDVRAHAVRAVRPGRSR